MPQPSASTETPLGQESFRTVIARKTNPGNPDNTHADGNFHVRPRNYWFTEPPRGGACNTVGRCRLAVFKKLKLTLLYEGNTHSPSS